MLPPCENAGTAQGVSHEIGLDGDGEEELFVEIEDAVLQGDAAELATCSKMRQVP